MRTKPTTGWLVVLILAMFTVLNLSGCCSGSKDPVDYVNPNIGTIGHLLVATSPDVKLPNGKVRLAPYTTPGITDKYLADKIYGFPIRESSHRRSQVTALLMATTGDIEVNPAKNASTYDHDFEIATPYYHAITLDDYEVLVELTVTENAAYYRFTFPESKASHLLLSLARESVVEIPNEHSIAGSESTRNGQAFFHAEFSKPFAAFGTWDSTKIASGIKSRTGAKIGAFASFTTAKDEQIEVRIGVSNESRAQAAANLKTEIPRWDFEKTKAEARRIWNESLRIAKAEGGTEAQLTKFYTALYRVGGGEGLLKWMRLSKYELIEEVKRYAELPKERLFPSTHSMGVMFQHDNIAFVTDLYMRGMRDFNAEKAYQNMRAEFMESTKIPWCKGPATELDWFYLENSFFPALPLAAKEWVPQVHSFERRQCVTVTLQAAYESWCLAQMAKALGKNDDYDYFSKHAYDYQKLYNSQTGFMAPKTADGQWVQPFDPKWSGGLGGRDYFSEMNSWTYTWYVPHDIQGLINLMGGREKFVKRLDAVFAEQYDRPDAKYHFLGQFPDETGLIGQYAHGNEFSRHIPYLYIYAGAPWKTQKRVREIMDIWYGTGPLGICGDEDSGLMSVWYVYGAMGIQPASIICPNYPIWLISGPIFEKVVLDLGNGEKLFMEAKGASGKNKYIQAATFNGAPLDKAWLSHSDLQRGGKLIFKMGSKPNKEWASSPAAAPPSMSNEGMFPNGAF